MADTEAVTRAEFNEKFADVVKEYVTVTEAIKALENKAPTSAELATVLGALKTDYESKDAAATSILEETKSEFQAALNDIKSQLSPQGESSGESSTDLKLKSLQDSLNSTYEDLRAELESARSSFVLAIESVESEIESIEESLTASSPASSDSLVTVLADVQGLQQRTADLETKHAAIPGLQSEVSALRETLSSSTAQSQEAMDHLKTDLASLKDRVSHITEKASSGESLHEKISLLEAALTSSTPASASSLALVQQSVAELTSRIGSLESAPTSSTNLDSVEAQIADVFSRISALENNLPAFSSKLAEVATELHAVSDRTSAVEAELPSIQETVASVQGMLNEQTVLIQDLKIFWATNNPITPEDWTATTGRLMDVYQSLVQTQNTVTELSSRIQGLDAANATLTTSSDEADAALATLSETASALKGALQEIDSVIHGEFAEKHASINDSLSKISDRVASSEGSISKLSSDTEALQKFQINTQNSLSGLSSRASHNETNLEETMAEMQGELELQETLASGALKTLELQTHQNQANIEAGQALVLNKADEITRSVDNLRRETEKEVETLDTKIQKLGTGIAKTGEELLATIDKISNSISSNDDAGSTSQVLDSEGLPLLPFAVLEEAYLSDEVVDIYYGDEFCPSYSFLAGDGFD
mmetsp:Transcript_9199/g.15759  ORF Transcript_9199/g.15759 Transcript_9199/m.15759 type:complete len:655 (+) Transcript_9199:72-2036(+)|eukprot:CAMPEP_0196665854 /NCGR_PEP_ID=MMETSP1086-20130531/62768_1 /TAXON_ID=77921 /ORGANISM="Cyanoptyche  gloeocystis , Strain SAG4.97" /LENGTH=654 /DNA_ID=CAMNT_0042002811 /DNA_START=65 /DNA_END=2029 /DNA_ORIENTATION=+